MCRYAFFCWFWTRFANEREKKLYLRNKTQTKFQDSREHRLCRFLCLQLNLYFLISILTAESAIKLDSKNFISVFIGPCGAVTTFRITHCLIDKFTKANRTLFSFASFGWKTVLLAMMISFSFTRKRKVILSIFKNHPYTFPLYHFHWVSRIECEAVPITQKKTRWGLFSLRTCTHISHLSFFNVVTLSRGEEWREIFI